ncbi:MAG TPA: OsmC family protein [Solirubrobacterales bacterium]|nr:OsmC family protein [Solirubrobacterales bacterium]
MRTVARRLDGLAHAVEFDEGDHTLVADEPAAAGGTDTGPRPTQLLAASLATCTAITVEMYAERKGWDVGSVEVEVETEYDGHAPSAFAVALTLPPGLDDEQRRRLLKIAERCPVHKALAGGATVTVAERTEAS